MAIKIGLIGGIIKDQLKADHYGTLAEVGKMGYRAIESGPKSPGSAADHKAKLDEFGLQQVTVGGNREMLESNLDGAIEAAQALGARQITTWWGPTDSEQQLLADAAFYNEVGAKVSDAGLKFCYHNHDHEFLTEFSGKRAIDILMENTEPDKVYFEIDVAWVTQGGDDPATFIRAHADRIPVIHLKDIADLQERGSFCAVGVGVIDVAGSLAAADEAGIPWAIVEQDRPYKLSGMESIAASMLNLREMGWA